MIQSLHYGFNRTRRSVVKKEKHSYQLEEDKTFTHIRCETKKMDHPNDDTEQLKRPFQILTNGAPRGAQPNHPTKVCKCKTIIENQKSLLLPSEDLLTKKIQLTKPTVATCAPPVCQKRVWNGCRCCRRSRLSPQLQWRISCAAPVCQKTLWNG